VTSASSICWRAVFQDVDDLSCSGDGAIATRAGSIDEIRCKNVGISPPLRMIGLKSQLDFTGRFRSTATFLIGGRPYPFLRQVLTQCAQRRACLPLHTWAEGVRAALLASSRKQRLLALHTHIVLSCCRARVGVPRGWAARQSDTRNPVSLFGQTISDNIFCVLPAEIAEDFYVDDHSCALAGVMHTVAINARDLRET
jgi:hypothetical protein